MLNMTFANYVLWYTPTKTPVSVQMGNTYFVSFISSHQKACKALFYSSYALESWNKFCPSKFMFL